MISLIALMSTLALANPVATGEGPAEDTCPEELATANRRNGELTTALEECEDKLAAKTTPRTAPAVRVAPKAKPAADTAPPPMDLRPGDEEEDAEDEELRKLFEDPPMPTAAPNNFGLIVDQGPMVTQVAIDFPKERRTREPKEPREPRASRVDEESTSPASAGDARYSVLFGATGGAGFAGMEPINDASGVAVGGGLEAPLSLTAGVLFREDKAAGLGLIGHVTVEPLQNGTSGGVDVVVMGGRKLSKLGFALGGNYTGFQSLDSSANAWMWGGEAKMIGVVPIIGAQSRVNLNLFFAAGAKGGVLYNENKADTTWIVDPVVEGGLVLSFGSGKLKED